MAKQIRQVGRALLYILPLVIVAVILLLPPRESSADYADPFWANTSPCPECECANCPCEGPPEWVHGVSIRTGEFIWDHVIFRTPGKLQDNVIGLRYRSMMEGQSQFGTHMLPSWEVTVQVVILNAQDPYSNGGHEVHLRKPSGLITIYDYDGSGYSSSDCNVHDVLTTNLLGMYVLTDVWNNTLTFDANGMLDEREDRNGNVTDYTHSGYEITSIDDDRGGTYTFLHNDEGFISRITDSASRAFNLTYDLNGCLKTIVSPEPTTGAGTITITLDYSANDQLISIENGRGIVTRELSWIGATGQIDELEIGGNIHDYEYYIGRVEVEDPLGNIRRFHSTGANVTQQDYYIDSTAEYVTTYDFNGNELSHVVYPEGNRVDYTWDNDGNLTERRHRIADTSTNAVTDLVHTWTYGSPVPISYTDPEGNEWEYEYDAYYNLTEIIHPTVTEPDTQTASETFTYNGYGQRLTHVDEESLRTQYVYFNTGASIHLLQTIQVGPDGSLLETEFTYDTAGNVVTKEDPNGSTWTYVWDNLRRLIESQAPSPLSHKVKYEYDKNGNTTQREVENRDKDGNVVTANAWFTTTYTYTNLNQLGSITEEIDASTARATSFYYTDIGQRYRVVKPEGNEDRWTFDERGLMLTHTRGYGSADAVTVDYAYDDNGNRVTFTDGRDNDTDHTFDKFNRRTMTTDALDHYTTWDYDKNGHVTDIKRYASDDTLMQRSTRYFDERGRLWKTSDLRKDPSQTYSDAVTEIERLKTGQAETVTNARGKDTTYTFDTWFRVATVTDAEGNEVANTYDDNGNLTAWEIEETDGTNTVTHEYEATYDVLNRRLTTVEIDRTDGNNTYTTTSAYDSRSNLVWQVNAEGNPTRWTYDGLNRMIQRERALTFGTPIETFTSAQVTKWEFDDNDRLETHIDDGANNSTWTYDSLDRPTRMTYPDSNYATYDYDANGNVIEVVDPAGNDIDDTFDALNRNTSRSITLATGWVGTTSETRTYDGLGRMLTNQDNDYKVTFTYGVLGLSSNVYTERQEYVSGGAYAKTVTKTYDAVGNKATETYPSSLALAYSYNDIDRLSSISDGTNTIASYTYWGTRMKGATFQNGATQANTYGGFRQDLTSVNHQTSSSSTIVRMDYGYNKVHDRTYERFGASGSSGDGFAYDKIRRLTNAWMGSATPSNPTAAAYTKKIDYSYDDDGNRTSVVTTPYQQSAGTTSYTTNSLYQYTNVGGTSQSWDSNGNLTDNGTFTFEYDYKNLPVYVRLKSNGNLVATYRYDALGRRVEKDLGSNNKQRYVYSGLETIATYNAYDTWKQDFVYAQGIDRIVMLEQADILDQDSDQNTTETTRSFYHRNALGSVMEITDQSEATVVSYRYDPYGSVTMTRGGQTQSTDPLGQHWTYTGRFCDEETGLYYYRARYYDPTVGRFSQRDPLGFGPGPGLYEYVGSAPLNFTDPFGLDRLDPSRPPPPMPAYADTLAANDMAVPEWPADAQITGPFQGPQNRITGEVATIALGGGQPQHEEQWYEVKWTSYQVTTSHVVHCEIDAPVTPGAGGGKAQRGKNGRDRCRKCRQYTATKTRDIHHSVQVWSSKEYAKRNAGVPWEEIGVGAVSQAGVPGFSKVLGAGWTSFLPTPLTMLSLAELQGLTTTYVDVGDVVFMGWSRWVRQYGPGRGRKDGEKKWNVTGGGIVDCVDSLVNASPGCFFCQQNVGKGTFNTPGD